MQTFHKLRCFGQQCVHLRGSCPAHFKPLSGSPLTSIKATGGGKMASAAGARASLRNSCCKAEVWSSLLIFVLLQMRQLHCPSHSSGESGWDTTVVSSWDIWTALPGLENSLQPRAVAFEVEESLHLLQRGPTSSLLSPHPSQELE